MNVTLDIGKKILALNINNEMNSSKSLNDIILASIEQSFCSYLIDDNIIEWKIELGSFETKKTSNLKELSKKGFLTHYVEVTINTTKQVDELCLNEPTITKYLEIEYANNVFIAVRIKKIELKTKNKFKVRINSFFIPKEIFNEIYSTHKDHLCDGELLQDFMHGGYDWWLKFECKVCRDLFFCECFKDSFYIYMSQIKEEINIGTHKKEFLDSFSTANYKKGICHFCTNKIPSFTYCSSMYGSKIKVVYGAYIEKLAIEKGKIDSFNEEYIEENKRIDREAENEIREILNYPKIGERWVNETFLFNTVKMLFDKYEVIREASPDWLGRQRLDIFIPELKLAIEYQGEQHYKPISIFGGEEGFEKNKKRDILKKQLCSENNICVVYFKYNEELTERKVFNKLKHFIID